MYINPINSAMTNSNLYKVTKRNSETPVPTEPVSQPNFTSLKIATPEAIENKININQLLLSSYIALLSLIGMKGTAYKDENGLTTVKKYRINGKINTITNYDSKGRKVKAQLYEKDGSMREETYYHNGNIQSTNFYDENGVIKKQISNTRYLKEIPAKKVNYYKEGILDESIIFDRDLKLRQEEWSFFKNGNVCSHVRYLRTPLRTCVSEFYYPNGTIKSSIESNDTQVISHVTYDKDGTPQKLI